MSAASLRRRVRLQPAACAAERPESQPEHKAALVPAPAVKAAKVLAVSAEKPPSLAHKLLDAGAGSIILLLATAVSLALANMPATSEFWTGLWETHVGPVMGAHQLTLRDWINEGLMCLFFFVVGLEIKRECVFGSLSSLKAAALPCIAALGGMVVPMGVFAALNMGTGGIMQGWPIPMATDIAFAMGIFGFFRNRMPPAVSAFLLTLATVDDLGAILVIAVFFAGSLKVGFLTGAAALTAALFTTDRMNLQTAKAVNVGKYLLGMLALWYCLLLGGINADVAGVVAAIAMPAVAPAPEGSDAPPEHPGEPVRIIDHLVHNWSPWTTLVIMPLFALANTAVTMDASLVGSLFSQPVALGIAAGLVIGKPIGITLFSLAGIAANVAEWPARMNIKHLLTVGMLGGIGFTMSLFLITLSLAGMDSAARAAKLSIILASTLAAVIGAGMMATFPVEGGDDKPAAVPAPAAA